ncbi:MAG: hypothetical protein QMB70_10220, partial [Aeromonadaceae bacterium]
MPARQLVSELAGKPTSALWTPIWLK